MNKGQGGINWYIVGLILGIAVIAVIGYWFFFLSGKGRLQTDIGFCKAKYIEYCLEWSRNNWDPEDRPKGGWNSYAQECQTFGFSDNDRDCKKELGQG